METEITIIGGGIAGLCLLSKLKSEGYKNVILLEKNKLGHDQTIASQGIIHSGFKYSFQSEETEITRNISLAPTAWKRLLDDKKHNLTSTNTLSNKMSLWFEQSFDSSFLKKHYIRDNSLVFKGARTASIFDQNPHLNSDWSLQERTVDIGSLLDSFKSELDQELVLIKDLTIIKKNDQLTELQIQLPNNESLHLNTKILICMAGASNQQFCDKLNIPKPAIQLRPLHMIMLKGDLPKLYGHGLGAGSLPKITITTHQTDRKEMVWYIGGAPAEEGLNTEPIDLVKKTKNHLSNIFTSLNFDKIKGACHRVNRAEAKQANSKRPDSFSIIQSSNIIIAWPTKLAFAPLLANKIFTFIQEKRMIKKCDTKFNFESPKVATLLWNRSDLKWY